MCITEAPGAGDALSKCIAESAALVAPLAHLAPATHHTCVVPTPGRCAETKFPAGINLVQAMAPIWRQWFTSDSGLSLLTIPAVSALTQLDDPCYSYLDFCMDHLSWQWRPHIAGCKMFLTLFPCTRFYHPSNREI